MGVAPPGFDGELGPRCSVEWQMPVWSSFVYSQRAQSNNVFWPSTSAAPAPPGQTLCGLLWVCFRRHRGLPLLNGDADRHSKE